MKWFLWFFLSLQFASAASSPWGQAPTALERQRSVEFNRKLSQKKISALSNDPTAVIDPENEIERPFSEVETAGYLLFHADTPLDTANIKNSLAKNLPSGVKLVVYTSRPFQVPSLRRHYTKLTGKDRVSVLGLKYKATDRAIWARDNTPIPVLKKNAERGNTAWSAVDAKYYGGDEPDLGLASWFKISLSKNPYEFEGGNFVADSKGNCVIVNKLATAFIPDSIFHTLYGCQRILRLRHLAGIGHADERVKFIDENLVLTDTEEYVADLQSLGYEVRLLPKPQEGPYRTYVNSLSINDSIFVPVFSEDNDAQALQVYEGTGKKVFPLNSAWLSDQGNGSIHCITMTYPPMPEQELRDLFR